MVAQSDADVIRRLRLLPFLLVHITKTRLCNFDPLQPHFYIVKPGFTGIFIIFLISDQNIDWEYSLEPPRRGGSNEYPQSMFWAEIWKNISFLSKNFQFLEVKFSIYLNRRVFVMRQHILVLIDHEVFTTVILSFLLIQEGQLSVSGKRLW